MEFLPELNGGSPFVCAAIHKEATVMILKGLGDFGGSGGFNHDG